MARRKPWMYGPLFFVVFLTIASPLTADQTAPPPFSLDQAAALMADAISHSKAHTVLVEDFSSAYSEPQLLGTKLADDFNAALVKAAHGFQVADRPKTPTASASNLASSDVAATPPNQKSLAVIVGHLWTQDDQLSVTLDARRWGKDHTIVSLTYLLPTPEGFRLQSDAPTAPAGDYPHSGKGGYTTPTCLYCPQPYFTDEAVRNKTDGVVTLEAIVGADGSVKKLLVQKGLPDGLTEQAIHTVRGWRLAPATGPDGKPAAVLVLIQVKFKLLL